MSRLRVAYLGSSASPHNRRWINFLKDHFDVHVVTLEEADVPGVPVTHIRRRTGGRIDYLLARRRVARAVAGIEPDLIHAHRITSYGYLAARASRVAARRLGRRVPFILSVWGEDVFSFPRASRRHRRFTERILAAADQILSTSDTMRVETERYVTPSRPIVVTPFGVDTARFRPAPPPEPVHAAGVATTIEGRVLSAEHAAAISTFLSSDEPEAQETIVIGTVKKLRARYGVDVLIRAFARARAMIGEHGPELELRIVGDGPDRHLLERLVTELGLVSSVIFVGRIPHDEVPRELRQMDIFAALSVTDDESFGVAMVEASATGLPVISTTVGGVPEVVRDGETGLLVEPNEVEEAAAAMAHLVRQPALRRRMGDAGRAFVCVTYDWKVTAERMRSVYERTHAELAGG